MVEVFLGLGSNMGSRQAQLEEALRRLSEKVSLQKLSSFYETEPVGYIEQAWFLNAVCQGETTLEPFPLLEFVKGVEKEMGRVPAIINGPRNIDIDILFYGREAISTPLLTIPHPRLTERAFVLVPLVEIAPYLVHPLLGKTAMELLQGGNFREEVKLFSGKKGLAPEARKAGCTRYQ